MNVWENLLPFADSAPFALIERHPGRSKQRPYNRSQAERHSRSFDSAARPPLRGGKGKDAHGSAQDEGLWVSFGRDPTLPATAGEGWGTRKTFLTTANRTLGLSKHRSYRVLLRGVLAQLQQRS